MTDSITSFLAEWAAAEHAGDTGTLDALLTDDFAGIGPLGFSQLHRGTPGAPPIPGAPPQGT